MKTLKVPVRVAPYLDDLHDTGVFVGFESLADGNLAAAEKKTPRTEDYVRRVAILHDHGIQA